MKKILLIVLIIIFGTVSVIVWQKDKIFSSGLKVSLGSREPATVLTETLEKAGLQLQSPPTISSNTIQASISGVTVFFAVDKNLTTQVRALQLLLSRHTIGDKVAREIDLRFNQVVVKY